TSVSQPDKVALEILGCVCVHPGASIDDAVAFRGPSGRVCLSLGGCGKSLTVISLLTGSCRADNCVCVRFPGSRLVFSLNLFRRCHFTPWVFCACSLLARGTVERWITSAGSVHACIRATVR